MTVVPRFRRCAGKNHRKKDHPEYFKVNGKKLTCGAMAGCGCKGESATRAMARVAVSH